MEMDVATALTEEAQELNALCVSVIQFDGPVFSRCKGMEHYDARPLPRRRRRGADNGAYLLKLPRAPHPFGDSYPVILEALEHSNIDQLALGIEASKLGPELLGPCPPKTVMFGCIDNSFEEVETPGHVAG